MNRPQELYVLIKLDTNGDSGHLPVHQWSWYSVAEKAKKEIPDAFNVPGAIARGGCKLVSAHVVNEDGSISKIYTGE